MSEVTYYVALPFVAADDGIAAGEAGASIQTPVGNPKSDQDITPCFKLYDCSQTGSIPSSLFLTRFDQRVFSSDRPSNKRRLACVKLLIKYFSPALLSLSRPESGRDPCHGRRQCQGADTDTIDNRGRRRRWICSGAACRTAPSAHQHGQSCRRKPGRPSQA